MSLANVNHHSVEDALAISSPAADAVGYAVPASGGSDPCVAHGTTLGDPSCPHDTECSDSLDNDGDGLIDALDPTIVRQNGEFNLSWDPNGNPACVLSSNVPATADGSVAGDIDLIAERQTIYSITCGNGVTGEVTLQVIPVLFET